MVLINTEEQLLKVLSGLGTSDIGFVPTMGALHQGHISLLDRARKENKYLVSSLFVNPTQFTNSHDLDAYPRPFSEDLKILNTHRVDIVFAPTAAEIYDRQEPWFIDLHGLDRTLEGASRPGHFQGVTQIVKIFFDLIDPKRAYFGQKDYQQWLVIKTMVNSLHLPVNLVLCPIIREVDGLAMSSRNIHLNPSERAAAPLLHRALQHVKEHCLDRPHAERLQVGLDLLHSNPLIEVDYFTLVNPLTLQKINDGDDGADGILLVAAKVGQTRLLDNMFLNTP